MINTLWKNQKDAFIFLLKVGFIYASWRILKYFGENTPGFLFGWWEKLYAFGAHALAKSSAYVLRILGYKVYHYKRIVIPEGYPGVEIADLCVGIPSIYIFTGLILAFGNNWRDRVWFIPMGWF
ncbi:MAG: hypothetical protein NZ522_02770, partial [Chitinophagales bacterium]|nr:hypothetical protein [Chitinophagales bacterium]